jgi:hypothetical protein
MSIKAQQRGPAAGASTTGDQVNVNPKFNMKILFDD